MTVTESYHESIEEAVARETARRKRVFITFLALLIVPIAIGAYALAKARTETDVVADKVTPVVTTRVTNEVVTKTAPLIRESVSREFSATVTPQITSVTNDTAKLRTSVDGLGQEVKTLQTTVQSTSDSLAAAAPLLKALPDFQNSLARVSALSDTAARDITTLRSEDAAIRQQSDDRVSNERQRTDRMQADLRASLGKEILSINDRLDRLLNESAKTANSNRDILSKLISRVDDLDGRVKSLEQPKILKPRIQQPKIQ